MKPEIGRRSGGADGGYLLDDAARQAPARHGALADLFDPGTIRHLESCGIGTGWRCLEIGGGGGSIARWLADRVGPSGRVVATDIDTRFLDALDDPRIEVRRHDVTEPSLPDGPFDLVHARLVLVHVAGRDDALRRMAGALAPGGWLVTEEFDSSSVAPDPSVNPGETLLNTHQALARLMADSGFDRRYGRLLFAKLRACGLIDVAAEARMFMCDRNSPAAALVRANFEQLRDALIDSGYVTALEFDADLAALERPDFMMPSSMLWSARGRRPATTAAFDADRSGSGGGAGIVPSG
jgi:SAM-dependent methyltransferase